MFTITENNRKWWILIAMAASLSMVFLDQSSISITLPQIQRDFNTSSVKLQWIVNAYLLAVATLVIFGGKMGDLFSHRNVFIAGISLFLLSSMTCGFAQSDWNLIISRALQGVGGAFMIPSTNAIVINAFPPEERGRAMGIYVGIAALFLSVGPLIGGIFTQYFSWRWLFWINLPLGFISLLLTLRVVDGKTAVQRMNIDWQGFVLLSLCMLSLVLALMEAVNFGWHSAFILSLFSLSLIALILFIWRERIIAHPIIHLHLFHNPTFVRAISVLLIMQMVFIVFVYWSLFLQDILKFSPAKAGIMLLPITIPIIVVAPLGGYLRDKFGYRWPMVIGTLLIILSFIWIGQVAKFHNYHLLFPAFLMMGCASPIVVSNCMTAALNSVSNKQRGMASGITTGFRQIGGSLGLAIISTLLIGLNRFHLTQLLKTSGAPYIQLNASQLDGILSGAVKAKSMLAVFSPSQQTVLHDMALQAYTLAFSDTMYGLALIALVSFIVALKMPHQ